MKSKKKFFIALTIICLLGLSATVNAFDFVEWLKGFLGVQEEAEEGVTFIPIEEIMMEEQPEGLAILDQLEENVKITVSNLNVLDETQSYESWLVDLDSGLEISLGTFELDENGNGELTADVDMVDISDSDLVTLTIEPVPDLDDEPSDNIVLKGDIAEVADVMEIKLKLVKEETEEEPVEIIIEERPAEKVEEKIPEIFEEEGIIEIPSEGIIEIPLEEVVEVIEEEIPEEEKPTVIIAEETELVSIAPKAADPDEDKLTYLFTSPLDKEGEWQTSYGDAGEYTITVTVSDGDLSSSKDVLIVVNKKEEAPAIDSFTPESLNLEIKETDKIDFSAEASDLNKDKLSYSWKVDGDEASTEKSFEYETTYDDSGSHTVKLDVSDGTLEATNIWSIEVDNVNRKPELEKISDIKVRETETVILALEAADPDEDEITYEISEPVGNDAVWETTYDDAGTYTIAVTVSDGVDSVSQDLEIVVENVNRAPVILDIIKR